MFRTLWTLILLPTLTYAQTPGTLIEFRQLTNSNQQNRIYGTFSSQFDKLRQGTGEYVAIDLDGQRMFAMTSAGGKDARVSPTTLDFDLPQGFQVSHLLYPETRFMKFRFDEKPYKVFLTNSAGGTRFRIKLRSLPGTGVGSYVLKVHLSFRVIDDVGVLEPQFVDVEIPIEVVERKAKVRTEDRSVAGVRGITPAEWAEAVLVAPLAIPVGIFMALIGWDGC